jgi:hypothetical protein
MGPLLVVELEEARKTFVEVRDRLLVTQVDVLVFDRPPAPLHKDVVENPAKPVPSTGCS